jgi:Neurotransmitter-gated ion-channel ligand binding domain
LSISASNRNSPGRAAAWVSQLLGTRPAWVQGNSKFGYGLTLVLITLCMTFRVAQAAKIETDSGLLAPPMVDNEPVMVSVGLFLTNLIEVDEVKEVFRISGYLFMTWKDARLAFPSKIIGEQRSYDPDSIWVPRILLINATSRREKISVNIHGDPDGTVHYLELFQAELSTSYHLEAFPFDSESLQVVVEPFLDERNTMTLVYDSRVAGFGTEPFVELAQWQIQGVRGATRGQRIGATGKQISELEIDVQVQRRYRYYLWKVFLPLLVVVAIAYSAFWIKTSDYYTQISITLTAILTEIAFLFAISTNLPKVPYLTFIDAFFLMSFAFSCACIVELVAVHQTLERNLVNHAERLRRLARVLYPLLYATVIIVVAMVFFEAPVNR